MPIYKRTYRRFEGKSVRRFRWRIVAAQELRVLAGSKIFLALLFLALLHVLLRFIQVIAFDVVAQDPNNPLTPLILQATAFMVNKQMFFDFIRIQTPLTFLVLLYAGSGMVGNDFRNNLMEVYFSKPLSWWDYAVGKALALTVLGLSITALPALYLLVMHNLFLPGWATLRDGAVWGLASIGFSLAIVAPTAMAILAFSALIRSQGYAAIAIFMLLIAESTIAVTLSELLRNRDWLVLSFPMALNRVGQEVFQLERPLFDLHWGWSMLYVAGATALCFGVLAWKARRAEVAA